ncbi:uncharacterized protein LOC112590390 [Harpegnathos saltator]|uniref:uncharacterized protein LOC112590390 n=1 Tax=Harpegnathos saltator TaxID=610380 RepID=UPI000DBEEA9B|nr:uncharacterized protein LOC112590390 [Harpegnathos saltator]
MVKQSSKFNKKKKSSEKQLIGNEKQRLVEELHASARRHFPRKRVIVRGYDDLWQADLIEMRLYSRFNDNYHYILTIIDVLSKYAWAVPLKSKSGKEVVENIQMDRFVTMSRCQIQRAKALNYRYVSCRCYKIADKLLLTVYNNLKIAAPARFKVGGSVRVSKFKTIFEKGYTSNWTTEVFKIIKVQATNPVTYLLEDFRRKPIAGGFYEYELPRAATPDVYLVEKVF